FAGLKPKTQRWLSPLSGRLKGGCALYPRRNMFPLISPWSQFLNRFRRWFLICAFPVLSRQALYSCITGKFPRASLRRRHLSYFQRNSRLWALRHCRVQALLHPATRHLKRFVFESPSTAVVKFGIAFLSAPQAIRLLTSRRAVIWRAAVFPGNQQALKESIHL